MIDNYKDKYIMNYDQILFIYNQYIQDKYLFEYFIKFDMVAKCFYFKYK